MSPPTRCPCSGRPPGRRSSRDRDRSPSRSCSPAPPMVIVSWSWTRAIPTSGQLGDHHAPSTVSAYWVHHPTEGDYLIDAGLARAFAREGGNYTALLRLILAADRCRKPQHGRGRRRVAAQIARHLAASRVPHPPARRPHLGARRPPRSGARGVRARRRHVHPKGDDWRPPRRQAPLRVGLRRELPRCRPSSTCSICSATARSGRSRRPGIHRITCRTWSMPSPARS